MQSSTAVLKRTKGPHWRTLKLMVVLLKFIACLNLLAGVALVVLIVLEMFKALSLPVLPFPADTALPILMAYLVSTVPETALSFLLFDRLAEFILLLIAIESNTRQRAF